MATVLKGVGEGIFDAQNMFHSAAVTKDTNSTAIKLRGTPVTGLAVRIVYTDTPGTAAQVNAHVEASVDNSTFRDIAFYSNGAQSWASGDLEMMIPFAVPSTFPYVRVVFDVTGGTTATSFGTVYAGIVPRAHGDWTRQVRWD